jgi:hypothetical protein
LKKSKKASFSPKNLKKPKKSAKPLARISSENEPASLVSFSPLVGSRNCFLSSLRHNHRKRVTRLKTRSLSLSLSLSLLFFNGEEEETKKKKKKRKNNNNSNKRGRESVTAR